MPRHRGERVLGRVARAAEAAGFESLWGGEHVVLPDPQAPPSPMAPTDLILDPTVALAYAAAVTSRPNCWPDTNSRKLSSGMSA